MDVLKLVIIFAVLMLVLKFKKPLHWAIIVGCLATIVLYRMPVVDTLIVMVKSLVSEKTLNAVGIFYLLSVLQVMMEENGLFKKAQEMLNALCKRNRANVIIAPTVLGILPAANALLIAAPFVEEGCGDSLNDMEKAFVTNFIRHIPESSLVTFPSVILGLSLCDVPAESFMIGMIPVMVFAAVSTYFVYLRRIPKYTKNDKKVSPKEGSIELIKALWAIIVLLVLIIVFKISVLLSSAIIVVLFIAVNRFKLPEIKHYAHKGFFKGLIYSTFAVYMFAEVIKNAGMLERLPDFFSQLPIPAFLVFAIVFFIGTVVGNIQTVTAIALPLAFTTIPNAGMPLLMLLMSVGYAAMQVSPAHICLTICADRFNVEIQKFFKYSLPMVLLLCAFSILYYMVLVYVFHI